LQYDKGNFEKKKQNTDKMKSDAYKKKTGVNST